MKKLKLFLCVALFGAMSFGALSAYEHLTMSDAERALLENVEALTSGEGSTSTTWSCLGSVGKCVASCGKCGTSVYAKGDLTGTHRCN